MFDPTTRASMVSTTVTHLHLLRHGAVERTGVRSVRGQLDVPVSAEGARQTEALARWSGRHLGPLDPPVTGVLSSDLARARVLAERVAAELAVPLRLEPALREQSMGAWEGRPWQDLNEEDPAGVEAYWTSYLDARPGGGESVRDLGERLEAWWSRARPELEGGRWVIVSHIGVIRVFLCHAFGLGLDQFLRFTPEVASHTWLLHAESGTCVQTLGERPWLDDLPRAPAVHPGSDPATDRRPRVATSGSAGTGKTTLARQLAERLDVPYVPEGMRERLEAGLRVHRLRHEDLRAILRELWEEQLEREERAVREAGGFVADRSPLDFLAFWLLYRTGPDAETDAFVDRARARAASLDRIVLLPWGEIPLVDDGVRSVDPWRQRHYQALVEGLLLRDAAPGQVLWLHGAAPLAHRVEEVLETLGPWPRRPGRHHPATATPGAPRRQGSPL